MAARENESDRLRRCRTLFERAQAIGCTPVQVRQLEAEQRWSRCAAKRCGTEIVVESDEGRELAWWQR